MNFCDLPLFNNEFILIKTVGKFKQAQKLKVITHREPPSIDTITVVYTIPLDVIDPVESL